MGLFLLIAPKIGNRITNLFIEGIQIIFGEKFLKYLNDLYVADIIDTEVQNTDTKELHNDTNFRLIKSELEEENPEI